MFLVSFEAHPQNDQWDTYLEYAALLRPELGEVAGFIDNVRYRSLTRDGWILSLSSWRDEKALVRWRTAANHHAVQEQGRTAVLRDYHLRVGQFTADDQLPHGHALIDQRLDETDTGEGRALTLISAHLNDPTLVQDPARLAAWLDLPTDLPGLVAFDVYEEVQNPGEVVAMAVWDEQASARLAAATAHPPAGARTRVVRVVRDYSMFDRYEAPQYYAPVPSRVDHPATG